MTNWSSVVNFILYANTNPCVFFCSNVINRYSGYGDVTRSNEPRSDSGIKIIY